MCVEMDKSVHRVIIIQMKYIVGIDEAGRGPLAGPVAVGVTKLKSNFNKKLLRGIKDSKKLSEKNREVWFDTAREMRARGELEFAVSLISEKIIDKKGIVYAINLGIKRGLNKLGVKDDSEIFLDGGIKAPKNFSKQKTIIKGDEKIPVISLASVCAKVTRDRYMVNLSKKYPKYNFHIHKGYGTLMHRKLIKKHGPCAEHRMSFLKKA